MAHKCNECIYLIQDKTVNNCKEEVVGTIRLNDSACYKIKQKNI